MPFMGNLIPVIRGGGELDNFYNWGMYKKKKKKEEI